VHVLSPTKIAEILDLREQGFSIREISRRLKVSREAVSAYASPVDIRKLRKLAWAICNEVEKKGIEPFDLSSIADLLNLLFSCRRHPHATPFEDVDDTGCKFCIAEGLKRHHERYRAAGKPIEPPWQKKRKEKTQASNSSALEMSVD
jgi:predicted transcriptional regulator